MPDNPHPTTSLSHTHTLKNISQQLNPHSAKTTYLCISFRHCPYRSVIMWLVVMIEAAPAAIAIGCFSFFHFSFISVQFFHVYHRPTKITGPPSSDARRAYSFTPAPRNRKACFSQDPNSPPRSSMAPRITKHAFRGPHTSPSK